MILAILEGSEGLWRCQHLDSPFPTALVDVRGDHPPDLVREVVERSLVSSADRQGHSVISHHTETFATLNAGRIFPGFSMYKGRFIELAEDLEESAVPPVADIA